SIITSPMINTFWEEKSLKILSKFSFDSMGLVDWFADVLVCLCAGAKLNSAFGSLQPKDVS
ncbi:MAG: hypothetical protein KAS71_17925, partial [Bacteroidales bacterium]|nr:hypothetical protein [Bacteroidales bacterium]